MAGKELEVAQLGERMTVAVTTDGETWRDISGAVLSANYTSPYSGAVTVDLSLHGEHVVKLIDDMRMMEMRDPLYPCSWCGTWKARKCSCPKCGAPDKL